MRHSCYSGGNGPFFRGTVRAFPIIGGPAAFIFAYRICLSEGGHAAATQRHTQCHCQIFEKSAPGAHHCRGLCAADFAGRGAADAAVCRTPRRTRRPAGRAVYRNERRLCDRAGRGGHRRHIQPVRAGCHCDFDTDRRSGRRVHRHGAGAGRRAAHQLKGPLPRAGGTERRKPGGHGAPCAGHPAGDPDLRGRRCGAQLPLVCPRSHAAAGGVAEHFPLDCRLQQRGL